MATKSTLRSRVTRPTVVGVAGVVCLAASLSVSAAPVTASTGEAVRWGRGAVLASGYGTEIRTAETPRARAVIVFATSAQRTRRSVWTVAFRAQRPQGGGWDPAHNVVPLPASVQQPVYAAAASNNRVATVVGEPGSGSAEPVLWLREQTFSGRLILERQLGVGEAPDIAIEPNNTVAVIRRTFSRDLDAVAGWTVTPQGRVTAGILVTDDPANSFHDDFYSPKITALSGDVFGIAYIDVAYFGTSGSMGGAVEMAQINGTYWRSDGGVVSGMGRIPRIALTSLGDQIVLAFAYDPGQANGLSHVATAVSEPVTPIGASWYPYQDVTAYRAPNPRLDTNLIYTRGLQAIVTDRVYLPDDGTWTPSLHVPVAANRCGYDPSSALEDNTLHWIAAVPTTDDRCAITDYRLIAGSGG